MPRAARRLFRFLPEALVFVALLLGVTAASAFTPCGGLGQRACCDTDPAPCSGPGCSAGKWPGSYRCAPGLQQLGNGSGSNTCIPRPDVPDDCLCPVSGTSPGRCYAITPCGGLGQRRCCAFEGHCDNTTTYCREDQDCAPGVACVDRGGCNLDTLGGKLAATDVCSGDCTCGDTSGGQAFNPWKSNQTCYLSEKNHQTEVGSLSEPATDAVSLQKKPGPNRRGYADLHIHLFGHMASGGGILAGTPFDRSVMAYDGDQWQGGAASALMPCANAHKPDSSIDDYQHLVATEKDFVQKYCVDYESGLICWPSPFTQPCGSGLTGGEACEQKPAETCSFPLPPDCGDSLFHGRHSIERLFLNAIDHTPYNHLAYPSTPVAEGSKEFLSSGRTVTDFTPNLGWPLFNTWPTWSTTVHQQTYHKWLERAWQGGLRLIVQHAVTNEALCVGNKRLRSITLLGESGCENSVPSIDAQIQAAKDLEQYIDEQSGPADGDGWFKIVHSPEEADAAIAEGNLAVVLGVEVDNPFGCKRGSVDCDTAEEIRAKVDDYYLKGVRHIFPIHNFENAFGAPAIWQSPLVNAGNRKSEGIWWWPAEECSGQGYTFSITPWDPGWLNFPDLINLGFGWLPGWNDTDANGQDGWHPTYGQVATCHSRGLTSQGALLIDALMDKGMAIDVDHMSNHSFEATVALAQARGNYPLVAGHVVLRDRHIPAVVGEYRGRHERMRTQGQLVALKDLGGMIGLMTNDDNPFWTNEADASFAMINPVTAYGFPYQGPPESRPPGTPPLHGTRVPMNCSHSSKAWAQSLQYAIDVMDGPVALATDFNGIAGHLGPRYGDDACGRVNADDAKGGGFMRLLQDESERLAYPFTLAGFGEFDKQVSGLKKFDFNIDGLAHVGLLPDLVADLENVGFGDYYLGQLLDSADAYVRMWRKQRAAIIACPETPDVGCEGDFAKGSLLVNEKAPGKEKLNITWGGGPALLGSDYGDPLGVGGTAYKACIYDDAGALVGSLTVPRAGEGCGGKPCWKSIGSKPPGDLAHKGFLYADRSAATDGVFKLQLKAGDAGKSKAFVKAKNNAKKGQRNLPIGLAGNLQGSTSVTVQLFGSDTTTCLSKTLTNVVKDSGAMFKAK